MECEVCGQSYPPESLHYVSIEGAILRACPRCARKGTPATPPKRPQTARRTPPNVRIRPNLPSFKPKALEVDEIVEDYAGRIREARESQGWTQQFLAHKLNERESFIKNIEAGRMKPPLEIAKRIEKLLNVQLLEKPVQEEIDSKGEPGSELTLGDIVDLK